ncbi:MAG: primosomal protein N' [Candidatus Margulisiibacteriota bacterium]|jgi:primosomal protein N' (replication factor Y)
MNTAQVLVFKSINQFFTYSIPEGFEDLKIGMQVEVAFGRFTTHGLVVEIDPSSPFKRTLKPILKILPKAPFVDQEMFALINWIKDYYLLSPYKAYQLVFSDSKLRKLKEPAFEKKEFVNQHKLTLEQEQALAEITNSGKQKFLLFGVTASGKTEIYMQLINQMLEKNKTSLMLLPEIALTPQVRDVFKDRFGEIVAVIHSGLTKKEREIEWNRIYQDHVKIVIGPRSALFSPLKNLGLIVIDEEHEPSYKQENQPRYFTHKIAEFRAAQNNALCIYGSATPSIETYYQFQNDPNARILRLEKRVRNQKLPEIKVIDMKKELEEGRHGIIAQALKEKIMEKLSNKEKIIILINRRGYATYIACKKCGQVLTCPSCKLSFTYHKDQKFRCHRCNIVEPITHVCPKCHQTSLEFAGTGIQKVEIELYRQFPQAKIYRLDRDAVKSAKNLEDVLADFVKDGDILIGTQLVAKGHDFKEVTLVGVLGIDTILNLPDYKSPERVFQLITQVAGRAGRAHKPGEVIVQTYLNDHPAIEFASSYDYPGFLRTELNLRKALLYPPFCELINLIISSTDKAELKTFALGYFSYLKENTNELTEGFYLYEPKPAPIELLNAFFRYQILIKTNKENLGAIKKVLNSFKNKNKKVRLIIDFDPKSLL